jgi:hypothetical protein
MAVFFWGESEMYRYQGILMVYTFSTLTNL